MKSIHCLPLLPLLFSCEPPEKQTHQQECIEDAWGDRMFSIEDGILMPDDSAALDFHIHGSSSDGTFWGLQPEFDIRNDSTTADCPVAIYHSKTAPDLSLVSPLSADASPAATDDNLGELLFAVNLAYARDGLSDATRFTDDLSEFGLELDDHYTFLSCEDAEIYFNYRLTFLACYEEDPFEGQGGSSYSIIEPEDFVLEFRTQD